MNEKLFRFFAKEIGRALVDGREYAFCHVPKLEVDGLGKLIATCTAVDRDENFYDFVWWKSGASPIVKFIGKIRELPVKNIEEVISYLEQRVLLSRIK